MVALDIDLKAIMQSIASNLDFEMEVFERY
jgi:hypothetical protein